MRVQKRYIIAVSIILLFSLYITLILDTNNVIDDFIACVKNQNIREEVKDTELYNWYNYKNTEIINDATVDVKRIFVFHNFKQGVLCVNFTYKMFDENGNEIRCAHNVNSVWHIRKNNGYWNVVEIEQRP